MQMNMEFAPVVLAYRFTEAKHKLINQVPEEWKRHIMSADQKEQDEEWENLHEIYSPKVLKAIKDLKGFYCKFGQVLAGRNDTVPDAYVERLRTLEDAVPPEPPHIIRKVVTESLGITDIDEVFSEWDDTPLGSASIGQVHKAKLKSTGEVVAVKVQYPGVERLFRTDIKTSRKFCQIFAPEQVIIFDEIERQFATEFDYRGEANNLDEIRQNMERFRDIAQVPEPVMDLCTKDVLVMTYLPGKKLYDCVKEYGEVVAAKQGKTFKQLEKEGIEKVKREGFPPKYDGPGPTQIALYQQSLRLRDAAVNAPRHLYNVLIGSWSGRTWELSHSVIPPNTALIMQRLLQVMGHQILVDGCFNGDPHGGNVLLMPDGRLGLIDYGQVKRLTRDERLHIARIYRGLLAQDKAGLRELAMSRGYKSRSFDSEVIYKMTQFALDTDGPSVMGNRNIQQFMDDMYSRDPWSATDAGVIMPSRATFMIRGIGLMLGHPVSMLDHWGKLAESVLQEEEEKAQGQKEEKTQRQKEEQSGHERAAQLADGKGQLSLAIRRATDGKSATM
ncbi:unnamed protein product [Chrysoparadoxa australica]